MAKLIRLKFPSFQLCGLSVTLIALFFMGGSSRSDAHSLLILSPLMIICFAVASVTLKREQMQENKWLLLGFLTVLLMIIAYLTPWVGQVRELSGALEYAVATRGQASDILAIAPAAAQQSIFFLFAPFAVSIFAMQLNRNDIRISVLLVVALGAISGIFGVLQLAGSADSPFYLYLITNNGSAVGFFANRNHAAVFLAIIFPMLAFISANSSKMIWESKTHLHVMVIAIGILFIPLILVTGSRSGMLAAVIGLLGCALLYISNANKHIEPRGNKSLSLVLAIVALFGLIFATIYFSRAEAIDRIFAEPNNMKDRTDFWTSSLQLFWQYFPLGFGPGGFVPAFLKDEPFYLLSSAYLNRLHNDWLETALTFGVPGILLMFVGTIYYLRRSFELWVRMNGERSTVALGRMASIVIAIFAVASFSDYPLRTPAMAGFAALALVWFAYARYQPIQR